MPRESVAKAGHPVTPGAERCALNRIRWLLDRPLSRAMTREVTHLFPDESLACNKPAPRSVSPLAGNTTGRRAGVREIRTSGSRTSSTCCCPAAIDAKVVQYDGYSL